MACWDWFSVPRDFHPNVARSCGPNILPGMRPKTAQSPHVCCRLNRLHLFGAFSSQDYRGLLESLFIKASQHENPSGQNPTAGCFLYLFLYICIHLCTEAWHCSLCSFSSPIGAGLQPAFHRNGCSLHPHPRTNTCQPCHSSVPTGFVDIVDENPGKHHVHYPSLYHCLSTCMCTLQVCWHLLTLYMYYEWLWQILINDI